MDLRQLAALVAVSDHGTFSAAAEALHTVQSNVSTHVRRLERELDAQLIDRAGSRLTAEGGLVVAPGTHPLGRRRWLTRAEVAKYHLLLPPPGTGLRAELDAAAHDAGVVLQPEAELDGVRLTASLVFQGYGVAVLPATAV